MDLMQLLRRSTSSLLFLLIAMNPALVLAGLEYDSDRPGHNLANFDLPSPDYRLCQKACQKDQRCKAATYVKPGVQGPKARCWLKHAVPPAKRNDCCITWVRGSGTMQPAQQGGPVQMQQIPGAVKVKPGAVQMKPAPATGAGQPQKMIPGLDAKRHETKFTKRANWDLQAPNLKRIVLNVPNPDLCREACANEKKCEGYTFVKPGIQGPQAVCYLKGRIKKAVQNNCCVSGAKVPPPFMNLAPNSPEAKANQQKAVQYKKNLQQFIKEAKLRLPAEIAQANRRIQLQQNLRRKQGSVELRDLFQSMLSEKPPAAADMKDTAALKQLVYTMATQKPSVQTLGKAQINQSALKLAGPKPEITGMLTAPASPVQSYLREGGYVLLFGRNFGKQPGKVMLTYRALPKEFAKTPPPEMAVTLEPWQGSWHKAWQDTMVVAKVPMLPPGDMLRDAKLTMWRDGQPPMKLVTPVSLIRRIPGVHSLRATPQYGDHINRDAVVFGAQLLLTGDSFGDQPGEIYIELTKRIQGKKRIDLLPGQGTWAKSWQDRLLYVKVPDLKVNVPAQIAMLVIKPSYGGQGLFRRPISFGPRMVYALVTGQEFLELDRDAPDNWVEENPPYLRVAHGPDCTWYRWFGSDGTDHFFRKKKMPDNTRVVRAIVAPVDPKLPWTTWEIVIEEIGNLVSAFFGSPLDMAQYFLKGFGLAIGGLFDRHVGKYKAEITKMPSRENPRGSVRWFTTCLAFHPAHDLPIVYITSFLIEGPAGFVPGEIVDSIQ